MTVMSVLMSAALAASCGGARVTSAPTQQAAPEAHLETAPFAGHGPVALQSIAPGTPRPSDVVVPLYAELGEDGTVTGTRCGATRFTDEGVLERDGVAIARVDGGRVSDASGTDLGWSIEGSVLTTRGPRLTYEQGRVGASDADLPAVRVTPADAPGSLVLSFVAALLVCDDLGP